MSLHLKVIIEFKFTLFIVLEAHQKRPNKFLYRVKQFSDG